ncbi:MAG: hypothetical protein WCE48_06890, partial [Steroidobacteraceae bacterium]
MKTTTVRSGAILLLAIAAAAGCKTTGAGYGTVRNGDQTRVTFEWHSSDDVSGKMSATFPDGRSFTGEYFQITSDMRVDRLAPLWGGWSPGWRGWRQWTAEPGPDFVKYYSGRVLANLSAVDGEHMRCRFRLVHPASGMS